MGMLNYFLFVAVATSHHLVVLMSMAVATLATQDKCKEPGWYGPRCKFKCRCAGECGLNGDCSEQCLDGWFGPACQYKISEVTIKIDGNTQSGNGTTHDCLDSAKQKIVVSLNKPHLFTWLRLSTTSAVDTMKEMITLKFWTKETEVCKEPYFAPSGSKSLDVHCVTADPLYRIEITGAKALEHLCSVHISQGRNLALRANATQFSTLGEWRADYAVDGNITTDGDFDGQERMCSWTNKQQNDLEVLELIFPVDVNVIRINVFIWVGGDTGVFSTSTKISTNTSDVLSEDRLRGFTVELIDKNSQLVYNYTEKEADPSEVYDIVLPNRILSRKLTIRARPDSDELVLCEVEVFGEAACESGFYGPSCTEHCNCHQGDNCIESTGACPNGCRAGFTGPDCKTDKCTVKDCRNGGTCNVDANGDAKCTCPEPYSGENCQLQVLHCLKGLFGNKCHYECRCMNSKNCSPLTGECFTESRVSSRSEGRCSDGWFGPDCLYKQVGFKTAGGQSNVPLWLGDQDDETCRDHRNKIPDSTVMADKWFENKLQLELEYPIIGHWVRISLKRKASNFAESITKITLTFYKEDDSSARVHCDTGYSYSDLILDYMCYTDHLVDHLDITGLGTRDLCGVYVSAGHTLHKEFLTFSNENSDDSGDDYDDGDNDMDGETFSGQVQYSFRSNVSGSLRLIRVFANRDICPANTSFKVELQSNKSSILQLGTSATAHHSNGIFTFVTPVTDIPLTSTNVIIASVDGTSFTVCGVHFIGVRQCPKGKFGVNCDRECDCADPADNECVPSESCHGDCAPGYDNYRCLIHHCERPDMYGTECDIKCRCTGECDSHGACSTQCLPGWFGHLCQYKISEVTIDIDGATQSGNGTTHDCWDIAKRQVIIHIKYPHLFRWLRFKTSNIDEMKKAKLTFWTEETEVCKHRDMVTVDNESLDVHCVTDTALVRIEIKGANALKHLCSVHIREGRNLAPQALAMQSSTFLGWRAGHAIDGHVPAADDLAGQERTCSHTDHQQEPATWTLRFPVAVDVVRIKIFNRVNRKSVCCEDKLRGFTLEFRDDVRLVHSYTDTEIEPQDVYNIVFPSLIPNFLEMTIRARSDSDALMLCEVEVFGEEVCPSGYYGPLCTKQCNCHLGGDCIVSTGACPNGCRAGFTGTDCKIEKQCAEGFTGEDCYTKCLTGDSGPPCRHVNSSCSNNCVGGSDYCRNGSCTLGCVDGYRGPACTDSCPPGQWGPKCNFKCGEYCRSSQVCSSTNGHCPSGCEPGYLEPLCQHACMETYYGQDCATPCRESCKDRRCTREIGLCLKCNSDQIGRFCEDCPQNFYGKDCKKTCSSGCVNETCDVVTGECEQDCPAGFYGYDCLYHCSDFCVDGEVKCNPREETCHRECSGIKNSHCGDEEEEMLALELAEKQKRELGQRYNYALFSLMCVAVVGLLGAVERYQQNQMQRRTRAVMEDEKKKREYGRTAQLNAMWAKQQYPFLEQSTEPTAEGGGQEDLPTSPSSGSSLDVAWTFSTGVLQTMMDPRKSATGIPLSRKRKQSRRPTARMVPKPEGLSVKPSKETVGLGLNKESMSNTKQTDDAASLKLLRNSTEL